MLKTEQAKLIEKLFDILEEKGKITNNDIDYLSKTLKIQPNEIKSIVSFYKEFSEEKEEN
ncbi:MAG: NAD(P)H-dependent oxidoreductase subunit E, partial [bacterium]